MPRHPAAALVFAIIAAAPAARASDTPGFTLLDRTDSGGRFEAFGTLQTRSLRAWINRGTSVRDVGTKAEPVWWVTPASPGVQLVDRVNGPVAWLFKLLTVGVMAAPVNEVTWVGSDGQRRYGYAGHDASDFMGVEIPASVLEFTWSGELRGGTLSGSNGRWLGMTFGYLQYPGWQGIEDVTALDPLSRKSGPKFLRGEGAYWATSSYASEKIAAVNLRLPLNVPLLGGVAIVWDLPMVYTTMALLKPVLGGSDDEGFVDDWGVPRVKVSASRSLGPLSVGAEYAIPARWLVVPYYRQGAHFALQAGLRF